MERLNLHRTRHADVEQSVIRFIERNWGKERPVDIVTGNSKQMKELVCRILDEYQLEYKEGDALGVNMGFIHVEDI